MATKTELVEKARLAKSAKLSGQVDEFIRASRQTNASTPAVKAPSAGQPAAPSLFAKLHRGRIPDAADDHDPVKEVVKTAPIAVLPTAVEATVPPAPRSAFAALARGRIPDNPDGGGRSFEENTGTSTSYAPAPRRPMASVNSDGARPAGKSSQFAALSRSRNQPQSNGSFARPRVSNDPAWGEPDIPAGSSYTPAQWLEARADGHCVVEVRNAAGESSLVRAPRHYDETSRQVLLGIEHVEVRDEDLDVDEAGQLSSLFVTTWDGCLLLEPSAPTTHPGAIRTELVLRPGGDASRGIKHKVVRPESCREKLHWLWGVKEWFDQHPDTLRLTSHLRPRSTPG